MDVPSVVMKWRRAPEPARHGSAQRFAGAGLGWTPGASGPPSRRTPPTGRGRRWARWPTGWSWRTVNDASSRPMGPMGHPCPADIRTPRRDHLRLRPAPLRPGPGARRGPILRLAGPILQTLARPAAPLPARRQPTGAQKPPDGHSRTDGSPSPSANRAAKRPASRHPQRAPGAPSAALRAREAEQNGVR